MEAVFIHEFCRERWKNTYCIFTVFAQCKSHIRDGGGVTLFKTGQEVTNCWYVCRDWHTAT